MVLAAGRGRRMQPLSDALPKPALPLPDGPVVGWSMRLAAAAGATRLVVNTWHHGEAMAEAAASVRLDGVELLLSAEPTLQGSAGGLALARDRGLLEGDGPVLVCNGDVVLNLDLARLWARHEASGDAVTLALLPHLDPRRWSRVVLDRDERVAEILPAGEPAPGEVPLLYTGVMLVARPALLALPSGPGDIGELLWAPARAQGRLGGIVVGGHWREVGTPADYLETVLHQLSGRTVVDPSAVVDPEASCAAVLVGRGSRIEAGASVERSVVAAGALVGSGATVRDSVLLGAVEAGEGASLHDLVLAAAR